MRRLFLILVSVILPASIVGAYTIFSLPTEIEKQIVVLNYEHKGEFDYTAYLHGSYLFDDIPPPDTSPEILKNPPSKGKYPIEIIQRIGMTFTYQFVPDEPVTNISEEVEVKAVLDKPATGQEEVVLVPKTTQTGAFTVYFWLDANELASSSTIFIKADVYTTVETDTGPMFESFTQRLGIQAQGPLLEIDNDLTGTEQASFGELNYEQIGNFDYFVRLKARSPFGMIVLRPPTPLPLPSPPPLLPSSKTLGLGEPLLFKLLDRMDVTFSYHFEPDRPVSQIAEEVEINAVLENPGVWSKTFVLVPPTKKNGDFTVTFPLDIDSFNHFNDMFRTIEGEIGAPAPHDLTIKADVHTVAQTPFGPIDEESSWALTTPLEGSTLEWEEVPVESEPGTIEMSTMVPNPEKFIWLSIRQIRSLSATIASIIFILFGYLLVQNVWFKPKKLAGIEEEALRARKKHKDVIIDIEELPEAKAIEMVVQLSSLDELIKVSDNLLKPVLHKAETHRHIYCVIDGLTRYQYISEA